MWLKTPPGRSLEEPLAWQTMSLIYSAAFGSHPESLLETRNPDIVKSIPPSQCDYSADVTLNTPQLLFGCAQAASTLSDTDIPKFELSFRLSRIQK